MKIYFKANSILHKFIYRIVFKFCIDLAYLICIVPHWGFSGYFSYSFSFGRLLVSYLLVVFLGALTPSIEYKISSIFFNTQLYIAIIPMTTLYAFADNELQTLILISFVFLEEVLLYNFFSKVTSKNIVIINARLMRMIKYLVYAVLLTTVIISWRKIGFSNGFKALDFDNVYDIREITSERMGLIEAYFLPWSTKVIIPFLVACCLLHKKWKTMSLLICIQVYLYLAYANKFVLFTLLLVFAIYYIIEKKRLEWLYEKGMILLILAIVLYDSIVKTWSIYSSLLIRRVLFIPAVVKFSYYDFFKSREKVHYADGLIGKILNTSSPYSKSIPNLIGEYMGSGGYMNTGYLGETYANGGIVALIIIAIFVVLFLCLLEKFSENINKNIALTSSFYMLYAFNEGAFFTLMLTYGGILLLLIFYSVNMQRVE